MSVFASLTQNTRFNKGLVWVLLGIVFYTDLFTQLGFAHGILYLPVVIYAMALTSAGDRFHQAVLAIALIGTAAGYFLAPSHSSLPAMYIITNRLLSAGILIFSYAYCLKLRTLHQQYSEISQLEQSQRETFEDLIDVMPIHVWSADIDGVVDFAGSNLANFSGKPRAMILHQWRELLHPDDRASVKEAWAHSVKTGDPYHIDFRLKRRDGSYVWYKNQATALRDEHGQIKRWLGSSIDIDDLHRYREQSERLATQFRHTVESITDAFFTLDHDFRFTYLNHKAAEILEVSVGDLLGEVIWEKCLIGYHSPFVQQYRTSAETHQKIHFEEFFPPGDKWLEVHVYPSPDGLTVYFSDITEQRKEREQLMLLKTAVSRLNDIIIITEAEPLDGPGPKTVYVNEAFEKLTGYAPQEIIGQSPRLLQGPKTDLKELKRIKTALEDRKPVYAQLVNYTKSGEEYWIELEIVPLADDTGHYTHLVAIQRDITQQKKMQEQLLTAQKMESIGQLTGGISHDFNNLLTVILGNAELLHYTLLDEGRGDLAELADTICNASEKGATLTRNLLAFARKQPLSPSLIQIADLLTDMSPILRTSLGDRSLLKVELNNHLWPVIIDPSQLESALLNLAINARDAMPQGGDVYIRAKNYPVDEALQAPRLNLKAGRYVQLSFSDTGDGISADLQQRVFEPFFTTKADANGSGLGLSMIYGLLSQSGGDVTVYSEPGLGTTFNLYLPCREEDCNLEPPLSAEALHQARDKNSHVLIIDDDPDIRALAVNTLKKAGYTVTEAGNGDEGLKLIQAGHKPNLMFTDIVMPGDLSGTELARRAKELLPHLKIILTSGFTDARTNHKLHGDEAILLPKPYRSKELLELVHNQLNQHQEKLIKPT